MKREEFLSKMEIWSNLSGNYVFFFLQSTWYDIKFLVEKYALPNPKHVILGLLSKCGVYIFQFNGDNKCEIKIKKLNFNFFLYIIVIQYIHIATLQLEAISMRVIFSWMCGTNSSHVNVWIRSSKVWTEPCDMILAFSAHKLLFYNNISIHFKKLNYRETTTQ